MRIIPISVPTPFYVGPVNCYLIAEEPLTLAAATEAVGTAVGRAVGTVQRVVKNAAGRLTGGPAKSPSKSTKNGRCASTVTGTGIAVSTCLPSKWYVKRGF